MLSHEFRDKILAAEIAHFIQVLDLKTKNTFQRGLCDCSDASSAQMFAKQHTETRRRHRRVLVLFCQIDKRQTGRGREQQPVLGCVVFYGQQELIRFRLDDFGDASAHKPVGKLLPQTCDCDPVKCHDDSLLLYVVSDFTRASGQSFPAQTAVPVFA